jgi:hypothetical protein
MKTIRILVFMGLAATIIGTHSRAVADQWDKTTKITFRETVQVPGTVLPTGTYVFRLEDSPGNRHIVRIFKDDNTTLVTTILAIPNYQLQPSEKTVLTYAERPIGEPEALEAWFYPGDNFGQQFVYPKTKANQLSALNHVRVPSTGTDEQSSTPASSQNLTAENRTTDTATPSERRQQSPVTTRPRASEPRPNPEPSATTQTSPAAPAELPHTASSLPLVALAGLVLLGTAILLKVARRA